MVEANVSPRTIRKRILKVESPVFCEKHGDVSPRTIRKRILKGRAIVDISGLLVGFTPHDP